MSKLPPARPAEVMRVLEKMGFRLIRQSGSHAVYRRRIQQHAAIQ